ncbi:sensor histidine kinase [Agaribacterium haliotis]|uniref:sensor histidine kinase n=1 Tax=Agaribacterium haliotis TaxID=2013869 RepID=UPI000BB55DF1|nr:HAMP domain-containing sensor histidine kinase [Agaribacterium haliotis]
MIFNSIRTRIVVYFVTMALGISLLFSLLGFLFSYNIEDTMFQRLLSDEAKRAETQLERGDVVSPTLSYVDFYSTKAQLPRAVLDVLEHEPQRIEFPGPGQRHYHLVELSHGYLLAEVSDHLVVRKAKSAMALLQLFVMFIIVLIIALLAWLLARRLVQPIQQLNTLVSKMGNQALPQGFSAEFKRDEIGMFARELDAAMQRLQAFIQREQDFTRDVSHELRTPLAISQGALCLLADSELDADQRKLLHRLQAAQDQMQQCIEALLTLAREQGFDEAPVPVLALLEAAIIECSECLGKEGKLLQTKLEQLDLELKVEPELVLQSNEQALRIIVCNLLANAFIHCKSAKICIAADAQCLTITNVGDQIDSDLLERIFQGGVKGAQSQGYGIGLALVKRLCERLSVAVSIENTKQGVCARLSW